MAKEFTVPQEMILYNLQLKEWSDMVGLPIPDDFKAVFCG